MIPRVFLSYQTADKRVAGQLHDVLERAGVTSFLAHETIHVSDEWRLRILEELRKADIFICLLSKSYAQSSWCVQESGIAAFRPEMTVIPLSLDGTTPQGFISPFQSVKVDPTRINLRDLIPGFMKHGFAFTIELLIVLVGRSADFRSAEANFRMILPHIPNMSNDQVRVLLEHSAANNQVHHAALCARDFLPPLLKSHGHLLSETTLSFLNDVCEQYAS